MRLLIIFIEERIEAMQQNCVAFQVFLRNGWIEPNFFKASMVKLSLLSMASQTVCGGGGILAN